MQGIINGDTSKKPPASLALNDDDELEAEAQEVETA
jgi:hypothetical protein